MYFIKRNTSSTYDHRTLKTRLPVRSALFKQRTGGLVVRWVTTSEYPLLYVFCNFIVPLPNSITTINRTPTVANMRFGSPFFCRPPRLQTHNPSSLLHHPAQFVNAE
ncbi:hypothetical protein BU25DRAFT_398153 [Macroventuria anomochaeta]|uniref:Uncharacterized protein n=1 Tax=Macroventuria anomochaeta TaxID=301207 RepID=A0ACB6RTD0_9PLEO|nr:uncharacterized protein BU25DRAFT_398153 [Macroventuria anomochaeta]KAF2624988.1 hypothetical protein BU25DRAFT_398153 [Macroventuria anomochaeta]